MASFMYSIQFVFRTVWIVLLGCMSSNAYTSILGSEEEHFNESNTNFYRMIVGMGDRISIGSYEQAIFIFRTAS